MAEIQADTIAENPSLCDWSLNSMLRKTNIPIAIQIQKMEARIDAAAEAQLVNSATDADLDDLVADRGLTRLSGTKAVGQVAFIRSLVASADITIPLGTQVATQDTDGEGPVLFATIAEVTLLTGTTSIAADVEACEIGARGNVRAAAIVNIPGGLSGVDSVTNPLTFTGGSDEESDADLRQRYIATATEYGRATVPTMKEWLELVEDSDGAKIVREAKIYNKGQGDIEAIADITVTEDNVALIVNALEGCMAGGVSARGMLAAHIEDGANVGDLGDAAGGGLWVRARVAVTAEDVFTLDYLYEGGGAVPHTASFTVPAGTVVGQCIQGTLEGVSDDVMSLPNPPVYTGPFEYDALIGYGGIGANGGKGHPYLFLTPEKVAINVAMSYAATDTPESDLAGLIEASITAFLDDFAIGEELQFSDLYDATRIQYLGDGEWGDRFVGIDEITSLSATDGTTTIDALGEKITVETDARIDPGTIAATEV
ncbi:MAG: baseplate J/gp47 family protein [Methanothrix sp.]